MAAQPLVTVIIPTYNRATVVGRAIESVLRQTYTNFEIIVVDDGSTDDTARALSAFGSRVRVVVQANAGPSAARNSGIAVAAGDIITFLDSDDLWRPEKLKSQVRLLQEAGPTAPCCLCNATIVDTVPTTSFEYAGLRPELKEGLWMNVTDVLRTRFVMFTQMVAVRRQVLAKVGGFNQNLRLLEDYELALRLSLEGPWSYTTAPLVEYSRSSPDSLAAAGNLDVVRLRESALAVRRSLYESVSKDATHRQWRGPFRHATTTAARVLRATKLSKDPRRPQFMLGKFLLAAERYRAAIHRRSPFYAGMIVKPVPAERRSAVGNIQ